MTQKERLLDLFRQNGTLSNYQLRSMQPPMFQFPTRIFEMIRAGYVIQTRFDDKDRKKYYYTLVSEPSAPARPPQPPLDLFGTAA